MTVVELVGGHTLEIGEGEVVAENAVDRGMRAAVQVDMDRRAEAGLPDDAVLRQ